MLPDSVEKLKEAVRFQLDLCGADLVDLTLRRSNQRSVITVLADKKGGISLDDCAVINRKLSQYFDEVLASSGEFDFLNSAYFLEVNSPGIDRPLRTYEDFKRVMGENLRISWQAENGFVKTGIGHLLDASADKIRVRFEESGTEQTIEMAHLVKVNKDIEFFRKNQAKGKSK